MKKNDYDYLHGAREKSHLSIDCTIWEGVIGGKIVKQCS
jgi:hypothetical protein